MPQNSLEERMRDAIVVNTQCKVGLPELSPYLLGSDKAAQAVAQIAREEATAIGVEILKHSFEYIGTAFRQNVVDVGIIKSAFAKAGIELPEREIPF